MDVKVSSLLATVRRHVWRHVLFIALSVLVLAGVAKIIEHGAYLLAS
jgi:hypothetical protein